MIEFTTPELTELKPKISVFGVGGAGGNAVNNMITAGLEGIDFVVANTDAQALATSRAEQKIQLGAELTQGLGAGARPDVGRAAAEETIAMIHEYLAGSHMAFITAGMGGGTGTGAAPVIAEAARERGILTVGVVTKPFQFEGSRRMRLADDGIAELEKHVDTLIIIPNQNLFRIANERTSFADAFAMADEVLHSGVRGITDLMVMPGLVNLDFADVRTVMNEMGKAMMGTGEAEGETRALDAAEAAISNPLLDEVSMKGAKGVLINISGGMDLTLFEVDEAANRIRNEVDPDANILVGSALNPDLEGRMRVSVVATGIDGAEYTGEMPRTNYASTTVKTKEQKVEDVVPTTVQEDVKVASSFMVKDEVKEVSDEEITAKASAIADAFELPKMNKVDDYIEETQSILKQLDKTILPEEKEEEIIRDNVDEVKEAPFIAPEPVMPKRNLEPLQKKADPFAEADMANSPTEENVEKKKGFLGGFLGSKAKKEIKDKRQIQQGDLLENKPGSNSSLSGGISFQKPTVTKKEETKRPSLRAKERVVPVSTEKEEEHLEIPAFLRRQAN